MTSQPVILIIDDDQDILRATSIRLNAAGFKSISTCDGNYGLELAVKHRPQAIVLDVRMPAKDGLTLLAELRAHPKTGMIPVVMLSASIVDQQAALDGGATFFVRKPYEGMQLVQAINAAIARGTESRATKVPFGRRTTKLAACRERSNHNPTAGNRVGGHMLGQVQIERLTDAPLAPANLGVVRRSRHLAVHYLARCAAAWPPIERILRESWSVASELRSQPRAEAARRAGPAAEPSEPPWVLCIDDDASYSLALKCRLESHGVAVIRAFEGMEGFRSAFARPADVILLDYDLPDGQGDYVLRRLKDNPVTKSLPVLVITGHRNRELERRMLALGAAGFMYKPVEFSELLSELSKHISILPRAVWGCSRFETRTATFPYDSAPNPLEA